MPPFPSEPYNQKVNTLVVCQPSLRARSKTNLFRCCAVSNSPPIWTIWVAWCPSASKSCYTFKCAPISSPNRHMTKIYARRIKTLWITEEGNAHRDSLTIPSSLPRSLQHCLLLEVRSTIRRDFRGLRLVTRAETSVQNRASLEGRNGYDTGKGLRVRWSFVMKMSGRGRAHLYGQLTSFEKPVVPKSRLCSRIFDISSLTCMCIVPGTCSSNVGSLPSGCGYLQFPPTPCLFEAPRQRLCGCNVGGFVCGVQLTRNVFQRNTTLQPTYPC